MPERLVVSEPPEVNTELGSLDLDLVKLLETIAYADRERSLCTGNDAKGFKLVVGYNKAARALRDQFCGEHWELDDTDNQAGIRHRTRPLRVVPCNFDENAGNADEAITPRNLKVKGAASKRKIRCNKTAWLPGLEMPSPSPDKIQTWILGFGPVDIEGRVGAELSLPLEFKGGSFSKFVRRIILDDRSGQQFVEPSRKPEAPTEIVDIPISRK